MNSKYVLGAVALSSAMFPLTEAFAGEMVYQVQKGDTFSTIAQKFAHKYDDVTYNQFYALLKELNEGSFESLDKIFPGDKIVLPTEKQIMAKVDSTAPKRFVSSDGTSLVERYKVQKGDTLSDIAKKYISWKDLYSPKGTVSYILKYNPQISNANFIRTNSVINIPTQNEVAKTYGAPVEPGRVPTSEEMDPKVFDQDYKDDALNPDFSGLRFNNMPGMLEDMGDIDQLLDPENWIEEVSC